MSVNSNKGGQRPPPGYGVTSPTAGQVYMGYVWHYLLRLCVFCGAAYFLYEQQYTEALLCGIFTNTHSIKRMFKSWERDRK